MVVHLLPARRSSQQHVPQKPSDEVEDSERTEEIGESFRSISSFRRHSLQHQESMLSDSSLHSLGCDLDHSKRRMRRLTISCLDDLDLSFQCSDRSFTAQPRLSLASTRRITTKRASDIFLREQRVSETMTNKFRVSMHTSSVFLDSLDYDDEEVSETSEKTTKAQEASKTVSFGDVEIREYGIIIGDNPGGLNGAPLTMEWDSFSCITIKLERYEDIREKFRRESSELIIPASHRASILMGLGFSKGDIRAATKKAAIGRQRRLYTLAKLRHHQIHERMERAKRTALNLVTLGYRSHAKRSYLKKHCPEHYQ